MDKKQIETTIERINHILNKAQRNDKEIFLLFSEREALRTAIECMKEVSYQLENNKSGQWKKLKRTETIISKATHYCSECEVMADTEYDMDLKCYEDKLTNYCPNCGAKMEKE